MEEKIVIPEGYELQKFNDYEYRIIKKEAELPKSWEEFCNTHPVKENECWTDAYSTVINSYFKGEKRAEEWKNLLPDKTYAEAILALCQLIQLRDCYRQGWKPDWDDNDIKSMIGYHRNCVSCSNVSYSAHILTFQSNKIRNKFFDNFKDLIEKTKPLFM